MLKGKTVGVVVPAYNEETQIGDVLRTMPDFVDRVVVVNDCSTDRTGEIVKEYIDTDSVGITKIEVKKKALKKGRYSTAERVSESLSEKEKKMYTPQEIYNDDGKKSRVVLINHIVNLTAMSVGAAIASGYRWCRDNGIYCTAVMAGDGQMDPDELESICLPVIDGEADYVKGNRLIHRSAFFVIPKIRYLGNSILSLLTKIASGYWHVSDTQTGYTAISIETLKGIRVHEIYPSYGCPNDILVKLNIAMAKIKEVPIKPVYNVGEKSKMKIFKIIPRISRLLFILFWKRLYVKYFLRDFHPLFLFYHFALLLLLIDLPYIFHVVVSMGEAKLPLQFLLVFIFLTISGFQALFFAMWMDMIDNERLYLR